MEEKKGRFASLLHPVENKEFVMPSWMLPSLSPGRIAIAVVCGIGAAALFTWANKVLRDIDQANAEIKARLENPPWKAQLDQLVRNAREK